MNMLSYKTTKQQSYKALKIFKVGVLSLCTVVLFQCTTDEDCNTSRSKVFEKSVFKGLEVELNEKSSKAIKMKLSDYKKQYNSRFKSLSTKSTDEKIIYPTLKELADIEAQIVEDYPIFQDDDNLTLARIRKDFPDLDDSQIKENFDKIEEFYELNMTYDVFNKVFENLRGNNIKTKSGSDNYLDTSLYEEEFDYLMFRPTAANSINKATNQAVSYTRELYPNDIVGYLTITDACRHVFLNVFIAKYYGYSKDRKHKGLTLAREFTDLHEECNSKYGGSKDWDCQMDYHNNAIGRNLYKSIATQHKKEQWFWTRHWVTCPSDDVIKNKVKAIALNKSTKVAKKVSAVKNVNSGVMVYFK